MLERARFVRDEESFRAEIETDSTLPFAGEGQSLNPKPTDISEVFVLPEPSLREQVRADTKYRQTLINEILRPSGSR
jgi:hypothetical protein